MKRSDMVKLMVDAFVCYRENDGIEDLNELMDKVLKTCEEEGMRPPALKKYMLGIGQYEWAFGWENETEEGEV